MDCADTTVKATRWWRRLYRGAAQWLLRHQGSPHDVALGFAAGLFVALTPTCGIQTILAALVAHALRANRAIPLALAWLTNPVTVVPIYYFEYRVGLLFLPGDPNSGLELARAISGASLSNPGALWATLTSMADQLWGIAGVLWAGSLLCATVAALASYPLIRTLCEAECRKLEELSAVPSIPPPADEPAVATVAA
jgi:uncharacterized protein (DUF2062 family)